MFLRSLTFLKKVKIIGNEEQKATIIDLASNMKSKGQCIVSIDSNSIIRATSLKVNFFSHLRGIVFNVDFKSNLTIKLNKLKHCPNPNQVYAITDQQRQFMVVCSRSIALIDITEKSTKAHR